MLLEVVFHLYLLSKVWTYLFLIFLEVQPSAFISILNFRPSHSSSLIFLVGINDSSMRRESSRKSGIFSFFRLEVFFSLWIFCFNYKQCISSTAEALNLVMAYIKIWSEISSSYSNQISKSRPLVKLSLPVFRPQGQIHFDQRILISYSSL